MLRREFFGLSLPAFCLFGKRNKTQGPFETAINISEDLSAAGTSHYASPIHFKAPSGYRTRILRVHGDFIAWPRTNASNLLPPNTSCEIGWGLKTTAPDPSPATPSKYVDFPGYPNGGSFDNSGIWLQGMLTPQQPQARLHFDQSFADFVLEADNIMLSQAFVAIDTTGLTFHMEPTFVVEFEWVKAS